MNGKTYKHPLPSEVLGRCRSFRKNATSAEMLLWSILRNRGLEGVKFRRQHPFHGYILDFYCHEAKLSIELDGSGHLEQDQSIKDVERTKILQNNGIIEIRFWNSDVLARTEEVLNEIWEIILERKSTSVN